MSSHRPFIRFTVTVFAMALTLALQAVSPAHAVNKRVLLDETRDAHPKVDMASLVHRFVPGDGNHKVVVRVLRLAQRGRLVLAMTIDETPLRFVVRSEPGKKPTYRAQNMKAQKWVEKTCTARVTWGIRFITVVLVNPTKTSTPCVGSATRWETAHIASATLSAYNVRDRLSNPTDPSTGGSIAPWAA